MRLIAADLVAHIARRLLTESNVGTMATTYPAHHPTFAGKSWLDIFLTFLGPSHVSCAGMPFSLQEYYARYLYHRSYIHQFNFYSSYTVVTTMVPSSSSSSLYLATARIY
jgi:hypothetical protein